MNRANKSIRYSLLSLTMALAFSAQAQQSASRYSGVITDADGNALPNAKVHVHGRQQYVYADAQGRFSILAPENSELHISASGYGDTFFTVNTAQTELNISLKPATIERIFISASGMHKTNLDMATPVSVLSGEELQRRTEPTIGETLKFEPGVHANYYGPVASSPIIRGLDGPRVRIMNNGLDSGDVSRVGPDHAISADALTAQQIEVLRGPATLLYGSGAIGGVINVVDNRVPRQLRPQSETRIQALYTDVSEEKSLAFNHEGNGDNIAWHFDGYDRDTADYDVPRFTNDEGESLQTLENSWLQSQALNAGLSYIGNEGFIGFSGARTETDYGIPGHGHAEEEAVEEEHADEGVYAAMRQNRFSMAAEWYNPIEGIETLSLTSAYTDYQHQEIEGGEAGTTFKNKTLESRFSLEHKDVAGWHGLAGYHFQRSDYSASGEEAFTPDSKTQSHALFLMEEKQIADIALQLGARLERTKHNAVGLVNEHDDTVYDHSAQFTASSVSAGAVWEFVPGFSWALAISRSERAPSAAELYANGAHIATSSYELGLLYELHEGEVELAESAVKKEIANNADLTFRSFNGDLTFTYNFFYNKVHNYLYQANTGLTMEDLHAEHTDEIVDEHDAHADFAIYQYLQQDATLYGLEFEARYQIDNTQAVTLFADKVQAKLDGGGNLPRIPPVKVGIGYHYSGVNWSGDFGATYYAKQNNISVYETSTDAYTLLDASVSYDLAWSKWDSTLFLRATNLTNELALVHSSFIKDDAPLPGRAITLGIRATF